MIDNRKLILPLLNFENNGDFYHCLILKRKKDFPEMEQKNHQSVRTIKTYCIDSVDYLDKRWDEIVSLSEMFRARVYIHVQKQNHNDISLIMLSELALRIQNNVINQKNLFDSVVGQIKTKEKRWIVDIDTKDEAYRDDVIEIINKCKPIGTKIITIVPTKNGYHLITLPFDVENFIELCNLTINIITPEIKKKNPTLLYYPNSLK